MSLKSSRFHLTFNGACAKLDGDMQEFCVQSFQFFMHDSMMTVAGVVIMLDIYLLLGIGISFQKDLDNWMDSSLDVKNDKKKEII